MGPNFDDAVACELQFVSADYCAFSVYHQNSDESVSCLHYSYFTLHISQHSSLFIQGQTIDSTASTFWNRSFIQRLPNASYVVPEI